MKKFRYILLFLMALPAIALQAQEAGDEDTPAAGGDAPALPLQVQVGKVAYQGDSIPHIILPELQKYPPLVLRSERERKRYNRLVANVKQTLPLAKLAKQIVIETYETLELLPTKEAKAMHLEKMEDELRRRYSPVLRRMSRSQGRLLIKLIDRECHQTGYSITKAFVGSFKANAYQAIAFCFGHSLTKKYDPEGDDFFTERVVRMVESGQL